MVSPFDEILITEPTSPVIVGVLSTPATLTTTLSLSKIARLRSAPTQLFSGSGAAVSTQANGSLRIIAKSRTSLQYSINGIAGPFQDSPFFPNLTAGTYPLAVRPLADCTGASAVGCGVVGFVEPLVVTSNYNALLNNRNCHWRDASLLLCPK